MARRNASSRPSPASGPSRPYGSSNYRATFLPINLHDATSVRLTPTCIVLPSDATKEVEAVCGGIKRRRGEKVVLTN
jgi:hypothetical protein